MLEHLGHQAIVVGDGKKALAALEADSFDVVLMDVQMPEMDGLEAVASLRQRERSTREHVRVIALTAYAMKGDRERCLRAGFDGYLSKPIHVDELRQALDDLVGDRDRSGDRSVQLLNRLLENCDDDVQFVRELVKSYLDTAPALLAAIDAALAVGDPARVSAEAHGLKGISQTIGIEELASTCRALEDAGRRGDLAAARALSVSIHAAWEEIRAVLEHLLGTSG